MNNEDPIFPEDKDYLLANDTDLHAWGIDMFAYIKQDIIGNEPVWSIYAAEGSIIGNAPNKDMAEEFVRNNDMKVVTLH